MEPGTDGQYLGGAFPSSDAGSGLVWGAENDFVENRKRILAQTRCAFIVFAPKAVAIFETVTAS
jgi:hypothetical protein